MAQKTQKPKEEKVYHIVNPAGAIHAVDYDHAKWRLQMAGWRMATPEEVQKLLNAGGNQVFDKPICEKWSPEPVETVVPE